MPDPRRLGKYEIRDILGKGAMGTVYRGFDPYIERPVAIKTINKEIVEPNLVAQFMARFRNEAKAAGRLHHPNIVGVYEYGEDDAVAFIAMEYVEGTGLREYVQGQNGFDFHQLVALMTQLLGALEFAHGAGIVHRDIKPSNLIVTSAGVLKVADFGIARVDLSNLTATGMIMGTPSYMSPEQCRGREADARSDLFSAGVVLYELLTGEKPFPGPAEAVAYKICHEEPEPPSKLSALSPPAAIDQLVATALAKDPARRFANARAFDHALREVARGLSAFDDPDATRVSVPPAMPSPGATRAPTHNLPQQVTSFVGRERELAELKEMLRRVRLLTLLGVGGIGKTRLALQAASATAGAYPDGVWLVELAPLSDPTLVGQAVAKVMGAKEEAGRPIVETLAKYVADRRLLLILDNCEHVLQACAELVKRLLQAAADITILTSSREPLHLTGETTYPVSPLAIPDPRETIVVEALLRFEAVRLFVDRAVAALPSFRLTHDNARAVAGICRRLDGIPLALELAAARVRVLSVEMVAARLDDRFRLLKGGDQTALPRQQTLRAMIDWSYDLLTRPQQLLLCRLAVFAGGFTFDAAEAVGAGGEIDAADVLDLASDLVEKSLVVRDADGERYRLLETVRQYAMERLVESGEHDAAHTRHLEYFLALAQTADPKLNGPEQGAWYARLDIERENLLAAHTWCDRAEAGAQLGLRLVQALRVWLSRGALTLGHRLAVEALARAGAQTRNLERCQGLFVAGLLDYYMGRYDEARAYGEQSLAVAQEINDTTKVADAITLVGVACFGQGDRNSAHRYLTDSLDLARGLRDKVRLIQALSSLAELQSAEGNLQEAESLYLELLVLNRAMGDLDVVTGTLFNLARISIAGGAGTRAADLLREALAIADEIGSKREGHQLLGISAALAAYRGEWERAARFFGAAESQLLERSFHREPADEAFLAPLIEKTREAAGRTAFNDAEAAGGALDYDAALADVRAWLWAKS